MFFLALVRDLATSRGGGGRDREGGREGMEGYGHLQDSGDQFWPSPGKGEGLSCTIERLWPLRRDSGISLRPSATTEDLGNPVGRAQGASWGIGVL